MWMGKSFRLMKYDFPVTINFTYKRIFIKIFDPFFYMKSEKVLNVPKYEVRIQPGAYANVNLQAEYIETIRRPENPCEESTNYSFTNCVKVLRQFKILFLNLFRIL